MNDPQARLDQMVARLKEANCRITPQRVAVLRVLATSDRHPTAEQIHAQIVVDLPTTSLATVYKTLALLKEVGKVQELSFGTGSNRYDGNQSVPHPHLVCTHCGEIVDLEGSFLRGIPDRVRQETGYEIVSHRLSFFGICPQCQAAAG